MPTAAVLFLPNGCDRDLCLGYGGPNPAQAGAI
jgi:hypothetical protein